MENLTLLKVFLEENKIDFSFSDEDIEKNSIDASLFSVKPLIIIFPKNKFEISNIIKFVNQNKDLKLNITSRAAGTDMSGGPLGDSIILSFTKYFNKIIEINKDKKFSIVEPGVYYKDFEKEALKYNLLFPSFPASKDICALGGIVLNNSGGEMSLTYGKTENYIEELECVLANGEIVNFKPLTKKELKESILESYDQEFKKTLEYKIYKEIFNLINEDKNKIIIKENKPKVSKNSAGYYL